MLSVYEVPDTVLSDVDSVAPAPSLTSVFIRQAQQQKRQAAVACARALHSEASLDSRETSVEGAIVHE